MYRVSPIKRQIERNACSLRAIILTSKDNTILWGGEGSRVGEDKNLEAVGK